MNIEIPTLFGLKIVAVPKNTIIQTEYGEINIDNQHYATDGTTAWVSEKAFTLLNKQKNNFCDFDSLIPPKQCIDTWPQMQRKKYELACQDIEIVFDAEKWIYERKSAYPMVDCIPGPADGDWKHFNYHPVCNGVVLKDKDVLILYPNDNYYVKPNTDQEGCAHHPSKCCECLLKEIDDEYLNYAPSDEEKHLQNADEAKFFATYLDATRYAP